MSLAVETTEVGILARAIDEENADFTPDVARAVLKLRLHPRDQQRMHELAAKAQAGTLTDEERTEALNYDRATLMLSLWQSKARNLLRRAGETS
jgi:hypothetical protein